MRLYIAAILVVISIVAGCNKAPIGAEAAYEILTYAEPAPGTAHNYYNVGVGRNGTVYARYHTAFLSPYGEEREDPETRIVAIRSEQAVLFTGNAPGHEGKQVFLEKGKIYLRQSR